MLAFVIDVNVAIVANGQSSHANLDCVSACVNELDNIFKNGMIVLDDDMQILHEYRKNLNPKGQPGVGDAFMKWVWDNQAVVNRCERVVLTPTGNGTTDFVEFPDDPALIYFDKSDRKYVAVAIASSNNPEVLNAVDTDWWHHRKSLNENGIRIRFLCPQHMKNKKKK